MWTKLDDGFTEHPKVVEAGPLGLALHVSGMVYCGRNLTDGYIPESSARRLVDLRRVALQVGGGELFGIMADGDEFDLPADLVRLGLWHDQDTVDSCERCAAVWPEDRVTGFIIHDYLEYNPTRAKVLADRASAKERRENAKRASAERRASVAESSVDARPNVIDPDPTRSRPAPVPDLDPEPDQQNQDPHLRAVKNNGAAASNGKTPFAIDDHQQGLLVKLWEQRPEWASGKGALTYGGLVSLMKKHGVGVVNEALEGLAFDPWAAENPHAWLDKVAGEYAAEDAERAQSHVGEGL